MMKKAFKIPHLGLLLVLTFLSTLVFAGLEATFAMWSRRQFGWGPEQNGYLFAFVGILSALIQGSLIGRLTQKFGENGLIIQGSLALSVGIALIPFSSNITILIIAMSIAGYGFSVISPALNSLISLQTGKEEMGEIMGVTRSASTMARFFGPAWAGFLFGTLGSDWPYFTGAMIMLIVLALGISKLKTINT
tara:strand:- start:221 stop:796 length:576 start_codon:yes stop_codon:yes gene_type:complete